MAYIEATPALLRAAFPAFADETAIPDATVQYWIEQAQRSVDASWLEDDRQMGEMLLAAHEMTLNGLGSGGEAEAAAEGLGEYRSIRSGSLSLERFDRGSGSAQGEIGSTSYGRRWLALAKRNRGGARLTPTGVLPSYPLFPGA